MMVQKGPNFPIRLTTGFPHTYSICLYSPVLQPGLSCTKNTTYLLCGRIITNPICHRHGLRGTPEGRLWSRHGGAQARDHLV